MRKEVIATILSFFAWGSGQFFVYKQKFKGLLFFAFQMLFIAIELITGYWVEYALGMFDNFTINLHGGFFTKGIWGFITLGTIPKIHHSTSLLITGIIVVLLLIIYFLVFIWNLKDVTTTSRYNYEKGSILSIKESAKKSYNKMFPYIVLSPIAVLFLFVVVMPIVFTVLIAFTNYSRNAIPPAKLVSWVGFENFKKLISVPIWSNTFFSVLSWTFVWAILSTFLAYFTGFMQAIFLNHKDVKFKKIAQNILILPWAMPNMITLLYLRDALNGQFGSINIFLQEIGLISQPIPFFSDTLTARIVVLAVATWLSFPVFMVMTQGVMSSIDKSIYEAAKIDGATSFDVTRYITLPLVMLAVAPLLVMNFAGNFNNFGVIYFLTQGDPNNPSLSFAGDTDILISWIYELTLGQQMYSMASVMSILIFMFVGVISYWNFKRTTSFKEM